MHPLHSPLRAIAMCLKINQYSDPLLPLTWSGLISLLMSSFHKSYEVFPRLLLDHLSHIVLRLNPSTAPLPEK